MPVIDKMLEMGDGDVALGTVRAFEAGVLDMPWSPNRTSRAGSCRRAMPTATCAFFDPGVMPFPRDVLDVHEAGLRRRAEREGVPFGDDLAVSSVYELSEPLTRLMPSLERLA